MRVSQREMQLLGRPSKEQTLALVGWLALCNAFGDVTDPVDCRGMNLPDYATRWAGELMSVAGRRGHRTPIANEQQVASNRKRKIRARQAKYGLVTGPH